MLFQELEESVKETIQESVQETILETIQETIQKAPEAEWIAIPFRSPFREENSWRSRYM